MAFDRAGTLKNAEKLIRLGRSDAAIEEYQRVLQDTPDDWKTTNTLADLYLRVGRVDRAAELLARIADHLARDGFLPRAEAFYKRILKVSPADEHALARLADLASKRGILVEAKDYLLALAKAQQGRNDRRAATETLLRLGALDIGDVTTRIDAARAAAAGGDTDLAAVELERVVTDLVSDQRMAGSADSAPAGRDNRPLRHGASRTAVRIAPEERGCRCRGGPSRYGARRVRGGGGGLARFA